MHIYTQILSGQGRQQDEEDHICPGTSLDPICWVLFLENIFVFMYIPSPLPLPRALAQADYL